MTTWFRWCVAALSAVPFAHSGDWVDWRTKMQGIVPLGYVCRHVDKPVVIDGHLDASEWGSAPWTSDFVDIEGAAKPKPRFRTRAKLLWDDEYLYIAAEMEEPHVWATLKRHDSVIFQDPDFEVFIDPDGDTHAYAEFEINAVNTTWDLLLDKPYQDGGPPHNEWELAGAKTAVVVHGTLNDPADHDAGWTVEIAFPWKAFAELARHPGPPTEGEQWRLNFSRVEWQISTAAGVYHKIPDTPEDNWVWTPQGVIDMHRPEMWGLLQFTRRPPRDAVVIDRIPGKAARDRAIELYYAQRDYFQAHNRWATSLAELGWAENASASGEGLLDFASKGSGYTGRVPFRAGTIRGVWEIREDRHLKMDTRP